MFRAGNSRYTAHPGSGATVDWSNPLTQGLRSLIVAGQPFGADIVRGEAATTFMGGWSAIQSAITEHGIVIDGAASGNSCQYVSAPKELIAIPSGITMFGTAQNDRFGGDPTAAGYLTCLGSSATNNILTGLGTGSTNARLGRFSFRDTANSTRADFSTTAEVWASGDKGQKVIAASYAGPGTQLIYVNGAYQALTVTTQLALTSLAPTSFSLGALFRTGPQAAPRLKTGIGGVWDRALSSRELEELTTNPWGLIAVPRGRRFVAVGYTSSGVALPTLTAIAPASITTMTCIPRTSATWA